MQEAANRKWCRIVKIGLSVMLGVTQEGERVVLARKYKCVLDAEIGDILSFIPTAPQKPPVPGPAMAKYFGQDPQIIGYSVLEDAPSHGPAQVEAKAKTEQPIHCS